MLIRKSSAVSPWDGLCLPRLSVVSSFGQFCGLDRFPNDIIHSSLVDSSSVSVSGSGKKRNVLQLNTASKKKKK